MKKTLIAVVITMATILILTTTGVIKQTQRQYEAEAVVIKAEDNGVVTVIDTTGNEREFYGEGFEIGDRITITLQDYNTRTPTDDEIVGAR